MNKKTFSNLFFFLVAVTTAGLMGGCRDDGSTDFTLQGLPDLIERAYVFHVFKREPANDSHDRAIIAAVKTATHFDASSEQYGLLFFQRNADSGKSGQGMLCPIAERLNKNNGTPDLALSCSQCLSGTKETLTVGVLNSEFCQTLAQDGTKAVATQRECRDNVSGRPKLCVCYDIVHTPVTDAATQCPTGTIILSDGGYSPPDSGSGSGGRR